MTVTRSSKRAARTGLSYPIPIPPSNSASTLSTLPFEILYRILSHLDTASALSLAQVAKAFGSSTEQAIWENVDFLTVYLNAPYVGLPDESDIRTYQEDEAWRAAAKEEDYRKLRRRYQAMANAADPRRWKMVKIVQAVTGEAVNDHLADLLVKVSETLNYLHLDYPNETSMTSDDFVEQSLYRIDSRLQLGGSLLSFPKLTYLHLGQDTIDSMAFIHFLCQASPNLLSLDFTFRSGDPDAGYLATPPPPRLKHLKTPTKIRYLRVDYDYTMGVDGSEESDDEAICELLDFCPLLRRLDLPSRNEFMWGATDVEVAGSWKDQAAVESVEYIRVEHHDIEYPIPDFLSPHPYSIFVHSLPCTPNIQAILFDCSARNRRIDTGVWKTPKSYLKFIPHTAEVLPITPHNAEWISANPLLRFIFIDDDGTILDLPTLDNLSKSGPASIFTSIKHGNSDELIHARILVNELHISDSDIASRIYKQRIFFSRYDVVIKQMQGVTHVSQPFFQDFTFYQGEVVPLEVINRMKEVEGISVMAYWDRRGVQVGEAAWGVIRLWQESSASKLELSISPVSQLQGQWDERGRKVKDSTWSILTKWWDGLMAEREAENIFGENMFQQFAGLSVQR